MDWNDTTSEFHESTFSHDAKLSSLPEEWQRELAALWRLEADVNGGGYLQFLANWGRETYFYASQALNKIGARKMAEIIDRCQSLVDLHFDSASATEEQLRNLLPNAVMGLNGKVIKKAGSCLPKSVVDEVYELSYRFMDYPDNISELGLDFYRQFLGAGDCGE